jgi:hypothetical protein
MGKRRSKGEIQPQGKTLGNFIYYAVLSIAVLVGITAYTAGASLDGSLLRVAMVLLVSTVMGCAVNIGLWLSRARQLPLSVPAAVAAGHPARPGGREIEVKARYISPAGTEVKAQQPVSEPA